MRCIVFRDTEDILPPLHYCNRYCYFTHVLIKGSNYKTITFVLSNDLGHVIHSEFAKLLCEYCTVNDIYVIKKPVRLTIVTDKTCVLREYDG